MSGTIPFRKMHGLGNDFVVVDCRLGLVRLDPRAVRRIGDRRCGVGFDQLVVLESPVNGTADLFMRIYNPDGSESAACGNAARCVGDLLLRETRKSRVVIQTGAGLLPAFRDPLTGNVVVDMGAPLLDWKDIPLSGPVDTVQADFSMGALSGPSMVSMGNPHTVFFVSCVDDIPLETLGPSIECHSLFPARTNVEIVEVLARDRLRMRVWERRTGITPACGSGACAVLVAAVRRGLAERRASVVVDGGVLAIEWREADDHVLMGGPVASVYTGLLDGTLLDD